MKRKVRPHRLYKKPGKLYIKKGNMKVVIHTSPSLSLKKILAYVQKNIKSERTQPKKQVTLRKNQSHLRHYHSPKLLKASRILRRPVMGLWPMGLAGSPVAHT